MKIALISDVHGNYPALLAALESKEFREANEAYCLGDLVGYYPYPDECVKRVAREKIPCVMGNHDYGLVVNKPCRDNKVGVKSLELTRKLVSRETTAFLAKLPKKLVVKIGGRKLFLVHGSPENLLDGYVNPEDEVEVPNGFDILAMGHTHKPFFRKKRGKLVVNPGSVGQPRDARGGACFAIIDLDGLKVKFYRVPYDVSSIIKKTESMGFNEAADVLRRLK